jgi:membrane-bound lytic murein transglycosylase D
MNELKTLLLLIFIIPTSIFANPTDIPIKLKTLERLDVASIDSLGEITTVKAYPDEVIDFILEDKLDSMSGSWLVNNAFDFDSTLFTSENNSDLYSTKNIPDSVFIERLKALNSAVELPYNQTVRNTIAFYAERRRQKVEIMLGLVDYYFPLFEEVLDKYNLPLELKYLAIIESALNPKALSRAGACGLWQFMLGTGKLYKLEINSYVDERRDPLKATEAAARYLSNLYKIYGDWHMVIAAYNCGPGNLNKAIKRSGGKTNYWEVYNRLPKETRGYVPAFIAASYIVNYYQMHNYHPQRPNFSFSTDTIQVSNSINLKQIAEQLTLDIEMLRNINPMYKRDIIPATATKKYPLVLPVESIDKYIDMEQEILAHNREQYFPDNKIKDPVPSTSSKSTKSTPPTDVSGKDQVFYTVKAGDNVGFIASWFDVKLSDLKYWNNLRGNLINVGQKLTLYVPAGTADHYSKLNTLSFAEKQQQIGATVTATVPDTKVEKATIATTNTVSNTTNATSSEGNYHYYTVKRGDNPWSIAKKYPGTTAEAIQKLNGITNSRGLYIGQQLKIMKN